MEREREEISFSVIVPAYNIASEIGRCLDSLLANSVQPLEILVVDDGSTDETGRIVKDYVRRYPGRIRLFTQSNAGQGTARNRAARMARGSYLYFLDGDDYVEADLFEKVQEVLERKPYDIVFFNGYEVTEGEKPKKCEYLRFLRGELSPKEKPELILSYAGVWNKVLRRSFYERTACPFPEGLWYEDAGVPRIWAMASERVFCLGEPLHNYWQRSGSVMHARRDQRMLDIIPVMRSYLKAAKERALSDRFCDEITVTFYATCVFEQGGKVLLGLSPQEPMLDQLAAFVKSVYPQIPENRYITPKIRRRLSLFLGGHYRLYDLRYNRLKRLKEKIEELLKAGRR